MAIKIVLSNKVGIKVKGTYGDSAGNPQPFDFTLVCNRLDTDQLQAKIKDEPDDTLVDFMVDVITDWSGVRDADDAPLPYSADSYRALCKLPGISLLAYRTYMAEVGVKEKN